MRNAPVREARCGPAGTEITIGVDIGTTAVKAIAVDGRGRVRARARVPHAVHICDPDSFEHDPAAAWCEGPRRAVAGLGSAANLAVGLGIAGCVPSLVALGDHLEPLSPGLLYGDWRGRTAAAAWPPESPLDIREGEAFLNWAAKHWPGARAYWPAQALAAVALGGKPVIDSFTAMSYFPVFDGRRWDPAELSRLGISEQQLPIVETEIGAPACRIAAGLAHRPANGPVGQSASGDGGPTGGNGEQVGGTGQQVGGTGGQAGGNGRPGGNGQPQAGTASTQAGTASRQAGMAGRPEATAGTTAVLLAAGAQAPCSRPVA